MSRKLAIIVASIAAVTPSLAANSTAQVTPFVNSTGTRTANNTGPISSNCCFVVQDSVNEYWWESYTTPPPVYSVVNVTSITTLVTPYSNGTVTNYETNIHTTNASFIRSFQIGFNPASLLVNSAPQPLQITTSLNGSQVTGPILQASPAAFWVYSRLKVITVPAVTNSNGDAVCATTSTAQSVRVSAQPPITNTVETIPGFTTTYTYDFANSKGGPEIFTISGVNSNAEAYFGGYNISGVASLTEGSIIGTTTESAATLTNAGTVTTFAGATETIRGNPPLWQYSNGVTFAYNGPTSTAAAVLTFPTPYVYFPSRGAIGATGESANDVCIQTGGIENYGYVPQSVIDYIASVPEISSQYPGIASCLPGGPSIIHSFPCAGVAPSSQTVVGTDLTSNTIVTVPGNVNAVGPPDSGPVTSQPSSPAANSPAPNSPSPTAQPGPSPNSPANSPNPQPISPAANLAPSQNPPANSPDSQPAGSQPNNNPPSNPTTNPVLPAGQNQPSGNPQTANPPASNSPNNQPGSSQNPAANQPNSQPAGNQPNSNAPSNPTANPASPASQNQASGNPQATNPAPSDSPNGQPGASQTPSPNSPNSQPAGNPPYNSPPSNPTANPSVGPGQSQPSGGPQASGNSQPPANNPGGIASAIASGIGMSQNPANPTPGNGSATQGSGSVTGGAQGPSDPASGSPTVTRGSGSATSNAATGPATSPVQASGSTALIHSMSIGSILGVSSVLLMLVVCV